MTTTPENDPGQWGSTQSAHPGERVPQQGSMPGHEQRTGQTSEGMQGQSRSATPPGGMGGGQQQPMQAQQQGLQQQNMTAQQWTGKPAVPVSREDTRVTGRRCVQYVIDYVLAGIIPGLAYWLLDRGSLHGFGWLIASVISVAVYFWYWVLRPKGHHGQTFGMQLFGLHIISKEGGPASTMQLFIRGILLIIDTLVFGLVGLVTMLCSKYRQRIGDHAAGTLVVDRHGYRASAGYEPVM
jgi:uncharacterized RDD family membrane protein YckC